MTTKPFLPYAHQSIDSNDIQEVCAALAGDVITRGPKVEEFEQAIASYCGAKYCVAFNSATAALHAAAFAANVNSNDRMITTPNTFVASVAAGMQRGATAIFVDIDCATGNMDLEQVKDNLSQHLSRGRHIVIPVHFSGIPVDMQALDLMIMHPDVVVIEDAAHAIGSSYKDGQKVGCCAWSQMTVFSFHPAKTITTGEGGAVTTNDEHLFQRLQLFRNNGIEKNPQYLSEESLGERYEGYYEVGELSGNYNLTEFQAALGLAQLKRLDTFVAKRRKLMQKYRQLLTAFPHLTLFNASLDNCTAFHLCVVQIDYSAYQTSRAIVIEKLKEAGIGAQVHYIPIYRHPFFKKKSGDLTAYFPMMEKYYAQALSLPLYYDLGLDHVERVVETLKTILQNELKKNLSKPTAPRSSTSKSSKGNRGGRQRRH